MPAYSESDGALSTKLLTFFPHNSGGLPTHNALIVLFHCQTGVPSAVSVSVTNFPFSSNTNGAKKRREGGEFGMEASWEWSKTSIN